MDAGIWVPINDYTRLKNISISTIRRYIKSGKIQYRMENGKYLIHMTEAATGQDLNMQECITLNLENQQLKQKVRKLQQEINDLKMLVTIYEKNTPSINESNFFSVANNNELFPDIPRVD